MDTKERIKELEQINDRLQAALGNLLSRIYCESMIPGGTLSRWQKELESCAAILTETGWYDENI